MVPFDDVPALKPISVAELDRRLKRSLENTAVGAWVEGEIASFKEVASGHLYFTLKDGLEEASIDCVMYRTAVLKLQCTLSNGVRIQVRGKPTLWAPRGKLQFAIDMAQAAGQGALLEALEQLKRKLAAEGIFSPSRKRPLPTDPRIIGVVTSANGAAIHDIARVAFRRGGARILLAPALVQGVHAARQIIAAIDRLERVRGVDVLIVGRGGGATEDLAAFQDERVVRRVASCSIPVVSAVGHEIDITLTDLAADIRAATPSQAAELVVPEGHHRERQLQELAKRLARSMDRRLLEGRMLTDRSQNLLLKVKEDVGKRQRVLEDLTVRLQGAMERAISSHKEDFLRSHARLSSLHPKAVVERVRGDLQGLQGQLRGEMRRTVEQRGARLALLAGRLQEMSPLTILSRGYSIALGSNGNAIKRVEDAPLGSSIQVRLHDGTLTARVEGHS